MNFEVRRLQHGDEQLALQVVRDLKPEDERNGREPSIQHLRRFLGRDTNYLIIALVGRRPVGFLTAYRMPSLSSDASMVYLYEIEVDPPYQRQGIGSHMVDLLKRLCADTDVDEIWVATGSDNVAAVRFYESTGGICEHPDQREYVYQLED